MEASPLPDGGTLSEGSRNDLGGTVYGSVLQVGALQGGIAVHEKPRPVVVPQQIPPASPRFTGRVEELASISRVRADQVNRKGGAPVVVAIDGMAGVGKTSLAADWAHAASADFSGGCLYLNLRGFDPNLPAVEPQDAINDLLDSLGVAPRDVPQTYTAQEALYRSLLADREVLIVLDNARSVEQIRPLLPASPNSMVLVTSRLELSGLVSHFGATMIKLQPLSLAESEELLVAHLGRDRVTADPKAAQALADSCARLPLALSIVAARAATRPGFRLSDIAIELRDQPSRLDYLDLGDIESDVRAVFSWSYSALSEEAALLFRLVGSFAGPDIGLLAAASLAGISLQAVQATMAELSRANLIEEHRPRRYRLHDLVRVYAVEQAKRDDREIKAAAVNRLLDHYVCSSVSADRLLDPPRRPISVEPPAPGVQVYTMHQYGEALRWFDEEHRTIVSAAELSFAEGCYGHTWRLAWAANTYFYWRAQWNEIVQMHRLAVEGSRRLADTTAEASALRGLGRALARLGEFSEAHTCQLKVLEICTALDDKVGQATTHHALSFMLDRQGDFTAALLHAEAALPLWRTAGNPAREARALIDLGWAHFRAGSHDTALKECLAALSLFDSLGNVHGKTLVLPNLSRICMALGRLPEAASYTEQQIAFEVELGNHHSEAAAYDLLGDIRHAQGLREEAIVAWTTSFQIFQQSNRTEAREVQEKLDNSAAGSAHGRSE